jgi:LEA14-like dessication related protein
MSLKQKAGKNNQSDNRNACRFFLPAIATTGLTGAVSVLEYGVFICFLERDIIYGKGNIMNTARRTIWTGAILLILFGGCDTLQSALNMQKPKASLTGVKIENVSLESASLLFDVEIENPYPAALPLVNIDYDMTGNSSRLFSGKANLEGIIPAGSTKSISLPVKISYLDVVKAFKDVSPGSKIPYRADVGLSVNAPSLGVIRLPLNKNGEINVPAIPKVSDIEKMILDKVKQP